MKQPINDGGPAFPQHLAFNPNNEAVTAGMYFAEGPGMSLRDWFAGMALQGILAAQTEEGSFEYGSRNPPHDTWVPYTCYKLADAMLAARERVAENP